jgi:CheY-like chemotaxis protein
MKRKHDEEIASRKMPRRRVLYMDDSKSARMLYGRILSDAGWMVETCSTTEEAFIKLNACPDSYDVVLSDVITPQYMSTGFELLRLMKQSQIGGINLTPFVATSACLELRTVALNLGALKFIQKPLTRTDAGELFVFETFI